jgi:hypothetical protein
LQQQICGIKDQPRRIELDFSLADKFGLDNAIR